MEESRLVLMYLKWLDDEGNDDDRATRGAVSFFFQSV